MEKKGNIVNLKESSSPIVWHGSTFTSAINLSLSKVVGLPD